MMRDSVCISVIYQYLRHIDSSLTEEFESKYQPNKDLHVDVEKLLGADMKFVTSSTSSASVNKFLAWVKLSRGNAQSVFFPQGVTV